MQYRGKIQRKILNYPKPENNVLSDLSGIFRSSGNSAATGEIKIGVLSGRLWHEKRIFSRLYSSNVYEIYLYPVTGK